MVHRLVFLAMVACSTNAAAAESNDAPAPVDRESPRSALLPVTETLHRDPVPRDPSAMGMDTWQQLEAAGRPFQLLYRAPAQAQASGTVLLVSARSGGGASAARAVQLRLGLTKLGYHTYLLGLPTDTDAADAIASRVDAAAQHMLAAHGAERGTGTQFAALIISEGAAGRWVKALEPAGIDGLGFVDVPTPPTRADNWLIKPTLPLLVVQTAPRTWPAEQPLGATTELHLLPRQSLRSADGVLLRTIRGWVKRLSAPAASMRS